LGEKKKRTAVILGVGNVLMRDDGAGVAAAMSLKDSKQTPRGVLCVDGGVAGLNLLPLIESCVHLIIIDAVRFGKRPGTVKRFKWKEGLVIPKATASAHNIGVFELLAFAAIGGKCPETVIIGIEPEDVSPGLELTPTVKNALNGAVLAVIKELEKIKAKTTEKRSHARIPRGAKDNRNHKKRDVKGKGKKA